MTAAPLVDERPAARTRRLGPRSLTARLVVGVVALVIVLLSLISGGTYYLLRSNLYDRLSAQLDNASDQNASFFEGCFRHPQSVTGNDINCFPYQVPPALTQEEWIGFIDSDGSMKFSLKPQSLTHEALSYTALSLSAGQARDIVNSPGSVTQIRYDGEELLLQAKPTDQGLLVVTGLSTSEVKETLRTLVLRETIIGAGAVVVAIIATLLGVRFSLSKLRRVTSTANVVAAELSPSGAGLDRRVDVPDDDTEVGQLAGSVNTLLSAVETQFAARLRSEDRLRQFLADASHELRTPLTSIRGYAELARMQRAAGSDSDDNLARIESEGTRMSRLVEDLLMLARGEQPSQQDPVRELVDVSDLVEDAARDVHAANPDREITADAVGGLQVVGDGDQLLRAVRNLVSNAATHTAPERPIHVRSAPDGSEVVIQVIDGGPGLPPEEAAHVFERFWRADKARSRARGGTGLGMSIVAAIVANHGGTVRFDSTVEDGSTVTIRLPAVQY